MKNLTFQSWQEELLRDVDLKGVTDDAMTLIGAIALMLAPPVAVGAAVVTSGAAGAAGTTTGVIGALASSAAAVSKKETVVKAGSVVLDKILNKKPKDYSGRMDAMRLAYCTICYTAFFDELDLSLPDDIRKKIPLEAGEWTRQRQGEQDRIITDSESATREAVLFPDILNGTAEAEKRLKKMYTAMAGRLRNAVMDTSFSETERTEGREDRLRRFDEICRSLPDSAVQRFGSYFLTLCKNYNEFYIYTRLGQERTAEIQAEERFQAILSAALRNQSTIQAGFMELSRLIVSMPAEIKKQRVLNIAKTLVDKYKRDIKKSVGDGRRGRDNSDPLNYPPLGESFIPQAYKLLPCTGETPLERPETWENVPTYEDLVSYLAKYCLDLGSTENLLLILGEPGAGKSLLSRMICGRMVTASNIFLYIPLRDYSMERSIETIVLNQLRTDGDPSEALPSLKWFQEEFPDAPMTIIFDGYDEILQATGKVHRNLLDEIHNFQVRCLDNRRPVRVIVTSRVTLIDKADIPFGTTVMKLLEFDRPRKEKWTEIWNRHNSGVLARYGLEPFALDEDNENVIKLSNQPLLLLMLAMYDADFDNRRNALKTAREDGLNRAALYDALLRRFIRRERMKGVRGAEADSFDAAGRPEELVDEDMRRLGAAALGMLVRGKLSLRSAELLEDLRSLGLPQLYGGEPSRAALNDAEALFGSFFFVHASHAAGKDQESREAAYEFLHKTFYEFLVADMCLGALIEAADNLDALRGGRKGDAPYRNAMENPSGEPFSVFYYTVLTGACLCREPEAVRIVREWRDGKLRQRFREDPEQAESFSGRLGVVTDDILTAHREIVRRGRLSLSDWGVRGLGRSSDDSRDFGQDDPQAAAVYLLNLVMLQILTSGECVMDEAEWAWLSQYVKLFVPLPIREETKESQKSTWEPDPYEVIILQFMSMVQIHRKEEQVFLTIRVEFEVIENMDLLKAKQNIFDFLGDNIIQRLVALHEENCSLAYKLENWEYLKEIGIGNSLEHCLSKLYAILVGEEVDSVNGIRQRKSRKNNIKYLLSKSCFLLSQIQPNSSVFWEWLAIVNRLVEKNMLTEVTNIPHIITRLTYTVLPVYKGNPEIIFMFTHLKKSLKEKGLLK